MATNFQNITESPEKLAELICYLKYPRMNHLPNEFEKSWLDWYGKRTEGLGGSEYTLISLWTEWLQEECDD